MARRRRSSGRKEPGDGYDMSAFESDIQRYLAGELGGVMPVERDYDEMPRIRARLPTPEEVAALETPPSAPALEALAELEAVRQRKEKEAAEEAERAAAQASMSRFLDNLMTSYAARSMFRDHIVASPDRPANTIRVNRPPRFEIPGDAHVAQHGTPLTVNRLTRYQGSTYESIGWDDLNLRPRENPDHKPYSGAQRVQIDVRLAERQIPEAMSMEAQAFKNAIKRKLENELLKAMSATEGFGLMAEDWQVLRQSLIDMIAEQSRLYFRGDADHTRGRPEATITFEVPKMTLSFRMPLDPDQRT